MGLVSHGLALGLGYMLGRPEGRERLVRVGRQAADLRQRPEVVRLQERGKSLVVEQTQAVKQKVRARAKSADGAPGAEVATTCRTRRCQLGSGAVSRCAQALLAPPGLPPGRALPSFRRNRPARGARRHDGDRRLKGRRAGHDGPDGSRVAHTTHRPFLTADGSTAASHNVVKERTKR